MSVSKPLSIAIYDRFYPLSSTPATSLTEFLPLGLQANGLILGGDPRKILYTLYSEEGNGFQRTYDLTCCDIDSALSARAVLLLSFLLDNPNANESSKLWNIFHDFYIDAATMEMIRSQSEKLVQLLASTELWEKSVYGKVMPLVNEETLLLLRDFFTTYSNATPSERAIYKQFKAGGNKVFRKYYKNDAFPPTLTRSFGVLATSSMIVATRHMQQFWEFGMADVHDLPESPLCNPLFVYSSCAGDKFAVNSGTNPLAVYHLAAHLPDVLSKSPFPRGSEYSTSEIKKDIDRVVMGAKKQFRAWSAAFQGFINQGGCIVIRFVVADPIAFCFALQQRNVSLHVRLPVLFSSPWSATPLSLNDDRHPCPLEFNVIETSTLADDVSIIDVLVATTPLLEKSPVSSISTETVTRRWSQETEFLSDVFCKETLLMCMILGIAPLGYITGATPRGLIQDQPTIFDYSGERPSPIHTRITWKIPASGDTNVNLKQLDFSCDEKELASALFLFHSRMLDHNPRPRGNGELSSAPANKYTTISFACFVAFMKRRVSAQWFDALKLLMECKRDSEGFPDFLQDLETQMYLFGLYSGFQFSAHGLEDGRALARKPTRGVLALADTPEVTCLIFTIPRRHLHPIYEKCFTKMRDVSCVFHIRIYKTPGIYSVFSSLVPMFGNLITSSDGRSCQIENDKAAWHGSSDLHICVYVPTFALQTEHPQHVSLNLSAGEDVSDFRRDYGPNLEIFKSAFDDASKVRLVESVPGHPMLKPTPIPSPDEKTSDSAKTTISRPRLRFLDIPPAFSTQINFLSDSDHHLLSAGAKVSLNQTSPCVITVTVGTMHHACQFPFPVDGKSAKLRIARKSGWIEVIVQPNVALISSGKAGYMKEPWPLTRDTKTNSLCNWNLPSVNFSNLTRVVQTRWQRPWFDTHLEYMFSDRERQLLPYDTSDPMIRYKICLADLIRCINLLPLTDIAVRFGVKHGDVKLLFLVTSLFHDPSSHNIVAEMYVVERKPNTTVGALVETVDCMMLPLGSEQAQFWTAAVPAMVERCRDWEHGPNCEHNENMARSVVTICSCGMGKSINKDLLRIEEWAELGPYVTRCALSPVFPAPYVEQTRNHWVNTLGSKVGLSDEELQEARDGTSGIQSAGSWRERPQSLTACQVCGRSENTRKCGRCRSVYYCGENCQKKDWKRHKSSCQHPK